MNYSAERGLEVALRTVSSMLSTGSSPSNRTWHIIGAMTLSSRGGALKLLPHGSTHARVCSRTLQRLLRHDEAIQLYPESGPDDDVARLASRSKLYP